MFIHVIYVSNEVSVHNERVQLSSRKENEEVKINCTYRQTSNISRTNSQN